MTDIAIHIENLSKQYRIGAHQNNRNFREALGAAFKAPFRRAGKLLRGHATGAADLDETIWALKDVSLDIKQGELVGLIGRNGSGKSTLLKVLSRITEPTTGYADIRGRIGSLLEVGTGFHPELTGRENIYLNGAILGMKKAEIRSKFDEIVSFAEVDKFIDTPVKHYSSGMYLRLAFAVAAHLETEILLVDEVLAVGDQQFQKKCLGKMDDVGKHGRTVIFVSHSMPAVTRLCNRAILLDEGNLVTEGTTHDVIRTYLSKAGSDSCAERIWTIPQEMPRGENARLNAVRVTSQDGLTTEAIDIKQPVVLEMEYDVVKPGCVFLPNFHLHNDYGVYVFATIDTDPEWKQRPRPVGHYFSRALIPGNLLSEGTHFVTVALVTLNPLKAQFYEREVVVFHVTDSAHGDSARGDYTGDMGGAVRPMLKWSTSFNPAGQEGMH